MSLGRKWLAQAIWFTVGSEAERWTVREREILGNGNQSLVNFFFNNYWSNFFFGCGESSLLSEVFFSCGKWVSPCGSRSCCGTQALGRSGFSSCSPQNLEPRLNSCGAQAKLCHGMWDLPRPRTEPMTPALAGWILYHWATREAPKLCFALRSPELTRQEGKGQQNVRVQNTKWPRKHEGTVKYWPLLSAYY